MLISGTTGKPPTARFNSPVTLKIESRSSSAVKRRGRK